MAPSVALLIAARLVQAVGGALMLPTSLGLILPEFEVHERHSAIGVWAATGGIAAAAGPPLGGLLVQADWRLVFLVNVPVGLIGLVAARRVLVERREPNALTPDLLGAVGFVVAIASLVLAIVKGPDWGWASAPVLALLALTAVLLAWIWRRSAHHRSPLIDPAMLRVRTFGLAVAASVVFFAGFAAMLLNGVLFLTTIWHESVLTTGLMLFPGPFMAALFSVPSARLGARVGYRIPGVAGALCSCRLDLVDHPDPQHARLRVGISARNADERQRRRPGDPDLDRSGGLVAGPGAVRHRGGGADHGSPGRIGSGHRGPRGRPGHPRRPWLTSRPAG